MKSRPPTAVRCTTHISIIAEEVWLAERTDGRPNIAELDPSSGAWKDFPIPDPILLPHGVTSDEEGHVWVFRRRRTGTNGNSATGEMALYHCNLACRRRSVGSPRSHAGAGLEEKNVWFTLSYSNELGKWDHETKTLKNVQISDGFFVSVRTGRRSR